ncbi:DNA-dependent RNA polymerase subunit epsilon [Fredinandcohnia quinoae]|uniref:DNA-directed RNA polymerase subunit epsilon n=1 Tax=Fredinandcohnia quinoae TaxID=2918902 RepID=A0AAW5E2Z0_9BACI|nr:DNA-directed RNA polymerase subunit epsilon [Fredinandcohnia sp. SECRCQ15]MCH1623950.1 DNA-dependent RNA polymerase auxiliary subunit epsilon family protein [Fredinandcohnia sp. SECRCQ15]
MIFKVYYQEHAGEIPVRENTKTVFVNAVTEGEVRRKLKERNINIEYIQKVDGAHLEYEKQNEDYKVLEI